MQNINGIQNLVEPNTLLLSWQAKSTPETYLVAKIDRTGDGYNFTYLTETTEFEAAIKQGFCGYPAFSMKTRLHNNNVLDAFLRRLPPKTRGDYNLYLQQHGLPAPFPYSDFALLGYTGAKSPADGFVLSIR